jgi:regulator of protease activity HflC (stomatin/prohibitin superfamily)
MDTTFYALLVLAFVALVVIFKIAVVVPQQNAYVVERLGKFSKTLNAGFHLLWPFLDKVAYKHTLKEQAADIAEQICITRDNVQVGVDGVLYLQVLDPKRASYGIGNYMFAISQLAQTTLRSEIGKIDLDRTFEERGTINQNVVSELDKASDPWGVKVLRYEIKNINPPHDVLSAMEKQMRAEREKRAVILTSEGVRDAKINEAEGEKQRVVKESEAAKVKQINEAVIDKGGNEAMQLRIAEQYIDEFGSLAKAGNTFVVPANLADLTSMMALATDIAKRKPAE